MVAHKQSQLWSLPHRGLLLLLEPGRREDVVSVSVSSDHITDAPPNQSTVARGGPRHQHVSTDLHSEKRKTRAPPTHLQRDSVQVELLPV